MMNLPSVEGVAEEIFESYWTGHNDVAAAIVAHVEQRRIGDPDELDVRDDILLDHAVRCGQSAAEIAALAARLAIRAVQWSRRELAKDGIEGSVTPAPPSSARASCCRASSGGVSASGVWPVPSGLRASASRLRAPR